MEDRKLEKKIRDSYRNIAPDMMGSVLSDCKNQKGKVTVMQKKKKKRSWINYIAGMAAALLLVVGGFTGLNVYRDGHTVASRVMLDVNPSLEIRLNKAEKVLAVNALNEHAKTVVGDMDFKGSNLDVTVNALIGSMLRNGFINDKANSVLVSVDSKDPAAGQEMQTRLMSEIDAILSSGNVTGAVLGQTVEDDSEINALAEQYGITTGKAKLIRQITQQNTFYTFEDLVPLSINQLNLIAESGGMKLENVESIGTASASAYIGEQAAMDAAYAHAGVTAADVVRSNTRLDWEDGIMVYEVDFDTAGFEFEYDVNAETGDIIKNEKEANDEYVQIQLARTGESKPAANGNAASDKQFISDAEAKGIALKKAGVAESAVYDYSWKLEHEHGIYLYEIEFKADGYEYEYDINAESGAVVKYGKEIDDDYAKKVKAEAAAKTEKKKEKSSSGSGSGISASEAKKIALKDAGVSKYHDYECEKETKRGKTVYEISFDANGYEYEYEINVSDGKIVKREKERD